MLSSDRKNFMTPHAKSSRHGSHDLSKRAAFEVTLSGGEENESQKSKYEPTEGSEGC